MSDISPSPGERLVTGTKPSTSSAIKLTLGGTGASPAPLSGVAAPLSGVGPSPVSIPQPSPFSSIAFGQTDIGTVPQSIAASQSGPSAQGSQVPNYTEPSGPKSSVKSALAANAQTFAKIQVLEKNDPARGKIARELFGGGGTTPQNFINTLQGFDKVTRDRLQSLFAQEIYLNSQAAIAQGGTGLNAQEGGSASGFNLGGALNPFGPTQGNRFQGVVDSIDQSVSNGIARVNETFKPVSTALGETLGNLSRFAQDPAGTMALIPGSIKNVIERNNPEFAQKMEATYKKYNLDTLTHLPGLILGNLGNLISDIDALVSLPFIILADLYQGLMDIINDIADAIQQVISNFIKKIFTEWLDGILGQILEILQELSDLAGFIGGISTIFNGVTQFTQVLFNVQNYIGQLGQFINNPLDLAFAYAPPQVSQALYLLRNPQQLVNNILPPQLSQMFSKVSQITGFGFNGNMGYGFVSVLEGVRGGVLASILSNFTNQYPILTSILGLLNRGDMASAPNAEQPPIVTPSPVAPDNATIKVGKQGVPVLAQQPKSVVATKEDLQK